MPETESSRNVAVGTWNDTDHRMMARALELAAKGVGQVSPGPLVGCVIVDGLGDIVGEGYYLYDEVEHAETIALSMAGARARGGTAFVSLEPHAHHARTPPCTGALIEAGIARVVAPIEDLNPQVSGRGFAHLDKAGIKVEKGLLEREAERLNEKYLHFTRTGRPFVHLKLATSLDGRIATRTGDSRWITGAASRGRAHQLRHEYDAILVGAGTAVADDPLLTDRSGLERRRRLIRVVLDERLTLSPESQLARSTSDAPVLVFAGGARRSANAAKLEACGIEVVCAGGGGRDLNRVMEELSSRSIQSVLVEGGAGVAGHFLDAGLVDKVTFFIAPKIIGGRDAPVAISGVGVETLPDALKLEEIEITSRDEDLEITGYPRAAKVDDR